MKMKSKRAAMEMSVGTMVTIVLLMIVLVLGIFFIQKIFKVATGAVDLTEQQLRDQLQKTWSIEGKRISIYPETRYVEIRQESTDGIGFGIRNLLSGQGGTSEFSYNVAVSDSDIETKCGVDAEDAEAWIVTGRAEENIPIPSGDFAVQKTLFEIPVGSPLCTIRFRIYVNDGDYTSDFFDMKILAK